MDFSSLNKEQLEAVECINGPLLILAGAGSGKTRVLTCRIANLIDHGVKGHNILALTFTNKAAREMHERVQRLLPAESRDLLVTTFHSLCLQLLHYDIEAIGLESNFVIYDDHDQMTVVGNIMKELNIDEKKISKRSIKERIGELKNKNGDPDDFFGDDPYGRAAKKVYPIYEKTLRANNALDFDDLLLYTLKMFDSNPRILEKYQTWFKYVLVDEYQDTNMVQYGIIKRICAKHHNLCVVGDDDQSIYGWRGADIQNILGFEKDFEGAKVIRLEQNYRSTDVILDAANSVIANNEERKKKRLWTDKTGGEQIDFYIAYNEHDEADYVCRRIMEGIRDGKRYDSFAVLYRTNAQSRVLETTLTNYGIPYKIFGGHRFYEREEIKDIVSYLRLILNPADDVAFMRIINKPRRGFGESALGEIRNHAQSKGQPLMLSVMEYEELPQKLQKKCEDFANRITELMAIRRSTPLSVFILKLLSRTDYIEKLKENKAVDYEMRMQNINEMVGNIEEIENSAQEGDDVLAMFLENIALVSDIDSMRDESGTVSLMTLHSAKGLEFPTVFITGVEENIFPSARCRYDPSQLEEERRLCYVGITRAKERLALICSKQRMLYGDHMVNKPSRFISEIPAELLKRPLEENVVTGRNDDFSSVSNTIKKDGFSTMHKGFGVAKGSAPTQSPVIVREKDLKPAQRVKHPKFGIGTVTAVTGSGAAQMVTIEFDEAGVKNFAAAYAPITPAD